MVDFNVLTAPIKDTDADTLVVYAFEDDKDFDALTSVDAALGGLMADLMNDGDFTGKTEQVTVLYPRGGDLKAKRVLMVGMGKRDGFGVDVLRQAGAVALQKANTLKAVRVACVVAGVGDLTPLNATYALTEGILLALYSYHGQKSSNKLETSVKTVDLHIVDAAAKPDIEKGIRRGMAFAAGALLARDLVNLPPNICTPAYLGERAQEMAQSTGLKCEVLGKQQITALKMGALLSVAQGSDTPPRFIILEHNADKAQELDTVVLVGKGITFDTGGYSLKSKDGMIGMKGDMGGAAAVIGAMGIIAGLDLPLHVVGLVPSADNMISGKAYRPQDVVTASNGKTIEIISTDAEGRLLLADALVYAKRFDPSAVVDVATLTGSCVVALGAVAAGLFSTDETLQAAIQQAAMATEERVWPLPMYPEYLKNIESDTADIRNSSTQRGGGASVAALFLKEFTDYPAWAHLDIAGLQADATVKKTYLPAKGATGFGARLLAQFVENWGSRQK